jgi:hypothetical protein
MPHAPVDDPPETPDTLRVGIGATGMIVFRLTATVRNPDTLDELAASIVPGPGVLDVSADADELRVDARGLAGVDSLMALAGALRSRPDVVDAEVKRREQVVHGARRHRRSR